MLDCALRRESGSAGFRLRFEWRRSYLHARAVDVNGGQEFAPSGAAAEEEVADFLTLDQAAAWVMVGVAGRPLEGHVPWL